jgi:hypothetical protein
MDALTCALWAIHGNDAPSDWKTNYLEAIIWCSASRQLSRFEQDELIVPVLREAGAFLHRKLPRVGPTGNCKPV